MVFGGLQKSSLIDYPGKISCVIFLSGCNFDCPYCHNPDLAKGIPSVPGFIDENSIYDLLESRKKFLDGVVISGGEPTLQKNLIPFCKKIKQIGYPIKLDTNGSRPQVLHKLIDMGLVDYIAMDVKTDPFHYAPLIVKDDIPDLILASIRIIMESSVEHEFRTTCIKALVDVHVIKSIARIITGSMLYVLQQFFNTGVLHPEFFQDNDRRYNDDELTYFKSIAEPWVKKCIIR